MGTSENVVRSGALLPGSGRRPVCTGKETGVKPDGPGGGDALLGRGKSAPYARGGGRLIRWAIGGDGLDRQSRESQAPTARRSTAPRENDPLSDFRRRRSVPMSRRTTRWMARVSWRSVWRSCEPSPIEPSIGPAARHVRFTASAIATRSETPPAAARPSATAAGRARGVPTVSAGNWRAGFDRIESNSIGPAGSGREPARQDWPHGRLLGVGTSTIGGFGSRQTPEYCGSPPRRRPIPPRDLPMSVPGRSGAGASVERRPREPRRLCCRSWTPS